MNRELGADFDLSAFEHKAVYDDLHHRIVITIVSKLDQSVRVADQTISFRKDEEIFTEFSHKYTIAGFAQMASEHGFSLRNHWTDPDQLFGVLHLVLEDHK